MSIKCILAAYSGAAAEGSGLRHAVLLTQHHDAWLTGILRHSQSGLANVLRGRVTDDFLESFHETENLRMKEATEEFKEVTAEAGIADRSDFVELDTADGSALSEFARSFDLIVTGVHSRNATEEHLSANPDLIALRSGRPVLVVPNGYTTTRLAEHALVAWDGKRSSARAIGDAMPILEEKAKVTLLTVGSKEVAGTQMLLRNLGRHGIDAKLILKPRQKSIANTILSAAKEVSANLVVMGAFEHSKFTHDVFGGVTTDVMRDAEVPVFVSH